MIRSIVSVPQFDNPQIIAVSRDIVRVLAVSR
jgi:hypothetical protein